MSDVSATLSTRCLRMRLYAEYVVWMHPRNAQPIGDKRFKSDLGARGIESKRTNQGNVFVGVKIAMSHIEYSESEALEA